MFRFSVVKIVVFVLLVAGLLASAFSAQAEVVAPRRPAMLLIPFATNEKEMSQFWFCDNKFKLLPVVGGLSTGCEGGMAYPELIAPNEALIFMGIKFGDGVGFAPHLVWIEGHQDIFLVVISTSTPYLQIANESSELVTRKGATVVNTATGTVVDGWQIREGVTADNERYVEMSQGLKTFWFMLNGNALRIEARVPNDPDNFGAWDYSIDNEGTVPSPAEFEQFVLRRYNRP